MPIRFSTWAGFSSPERVTERFPATLRNFKGVFRDGAARERYLREIRWPGAFDLHGLRAGMVRPERDAIGGEHPIEIDECRAVHAL
jgi:hypothetical protein